MAAHNAATAREIFLEAFAAAVFVGRFGPAERLRDIAKAVAATPTPRPPRPLDLLLDGLITQATEGCQAARVQLQGAVDAYAEAADDHTVSIGWLGMACSAALDIWDDKVWRTLAERQVRIARKDGP
ncbi:hypothetical protein STRCI_008279 [Streptomyces cinnabarinus]|uniref:Uncharacterized protein n=1 Tax=Streptomyces cinnabarinus TaxID=67287 RepID=A0ABY7KQ23_9ACTN|nr:hypothetical protein [Streptomyces cinnabarinus]WAZ26668.1 hypothetical protein STRCI_008279 [Streptomyces cinnabarinus]